MAHAISAEGKGETSWVQRHVRVSSKLHGRVKAEDKVQFFQQLTTLVAAGTPLLESLRIAAQQSQSTRMQAVVHAIADEVASGQSLHQSAGEFPKVFDRQWVEVIKTGETSGQLTDVLTALTGHILAGREVRRKIVSAMIYPAILTVVAVLAVAVMLWKVVPTFAEFFKEFGAELPAVTQGVIDLSNFLQENGLILLVAVVAAVVGLRSYVRTERGRCLLNQLVLVTPVIGDCAVHAYMAKFATNMVLLLRSGLPLLEAISSLRGVFHNNPVYREALATIEQRVAAGGALATALDESGLFTSMVVSMVSVGEESGQLPRVLEEVGKYYRRKVAAAVERLTSTIEPMVILGMGVAVAVILASIYLPMFQMASGPR